MKTQAVLLLASLALLSPVNFTASAQTSAAIPPKAAGALATNFSSLPLTFETNQGQTDPQVKFLSHGNGYSLFLTDSSAVLVLAKRERNPRSAEKDLSGHASVVGDVVRMELSGAEPKLRAVGAELLPSTANYFIGNDPAKWRAKVPTYARVRYEGVYPGIDLVYYGNQRQLEYDFVVAPGADPKLLRLHFAGAQKLRLTPGGDLAIVAKNGEIVFHKPMVYQLKNGLREPVGGHFRILARNNVGFNLGGYNHTRELVIDPALAYSTYLGGSGGDTGNAVAVNAAGDFYVVGGTFSSDFPATAGAFQKENVGMEFPDGGPAGNAFIAKFNSRGSALIYSTYLGGTTPNESMGDWDGDVATGVAIDAAGNAYVTGYASSYNFPVTSSAFQKINNADPTLSNAGAHGNNAFVTKLNATGTALIYSTYFGGSGGWSEDFDHYYGETASGIAIDAAGNAYIAGTAASSDLPVTSNAFQKVNNAGRGNFNLFVAKFNSTGSALAYATYLGGSGVNPGREVSADTAGGIAIDSAGDAYMTGTAYSRDFPVTANSYQKVNNSPYSALYGDGGSNAIITELNPTGSALVYSTYLGGSFAASGGYATDGGSSIAVNSEGNAYVAGSADSLDFPTTPGAFQTTLSGNNGYNVFVTELNATGSGLVYSTFLGAQSEYGFDTGNSIALDAFGSAYITGSTNATNFPVTPDAFRKANHAPNPNAYTGNAFISKLDPTGSTLLYSSYLGGSAGIVAAYGEKGNGIAVDWFGDAYITGQTCSTNFPLAGGPYQASNKGTGCTAFVSKFIVNTVTGTTLTSDGNPQKAGVAVTFTAAVTPNTGSTVPTGSLAFSIDGTPQITVPLDDTGHASFSTSALTDGRSVITAVYSGSPTFSGSSASLGQTIIGPPARITVAFGANQSSAEGTPFAMPLVAQVQDSRGVLVSGAVVDFSGLGLSFTGNPVVTDASGKASVVATPTAGGSLTASATVAGVATPASFSLTATQP